MIHLLSLIKHSETNSTSYNICLLGEPKIGKTTIIKEVCEKLAGEDGYIFLEMNGEAGADAISGIVYEDCDKVEDIIDDIESNKTTKYSDLKAIVIDTYDGWIKLAESEAIRKWNVDHPDKRERILLMQHGMVFRRGRVRLLNICLILLQGCVESALL